MDSTKLLLFFFIGFGFTSCSASYNREYHYVTESLNWTEAQKYCREKYTDLATIESVEDLSRLNRPSGVTTYVWIGLSDDPKSWKGVMNNDSNSWRWSATGKTSETAYQNWNTNEPTNHLGRVVCVYIGDQGYWVDFHCDNKTHFVCFNESNPPGQRNYTLIKRSLNWTEAQTYCRTHHTDLATIENTQENEEVKSLMTTNSVSSAWIGLYRVRWRWSDNSSSSFTNWRSGEPNNIERRCVLEDPTHGWHDEPCDMKHSFLCYKGGVQSSLVPIREIAVAVDPHHSGGTEAGEPTEKKKTMVRMKIQTFADLSDPATNAQFLQQLSERFTALHGDVKLRWVTQPTKQEEDDDEDDETCN